MLTEKVDGLEAYNVRSVACGEFHSLAINDWGQVFSWGAAAHGQLGELYYMYLCPGYLYYLFNHDVTRTS